MALAVKRDSRAASGCSADTQSAYWRRMKRSCACWKRTRYACHAALSRFASPLGSPLLPLGAPCRSVSMDLLAKAITASIFSSASGKRPRRRSTRASSQSESSVCGRSACSTATACSVAASAFESFDGVTCLGGSGLPSGLSAAGAGEPCVAVWLRSAFSIRREISIIWESHRAPPSNVVRSCVEQRSSISKPCFSVNPL
mmetsp:Transcript_22907/g.50091  ORF Transcript_22907/g.50091 Transcript_22907/m.50091 type:complete len:200 (-) Transcript_22907:621-1220(-)